MSKRTSRSASTKAHEPPKSDTSIWGVFKGELLKLVAAGLVGALGTAIVFMATPFRDFVTARFHAWRPFGKPTRGNFSGDWKIARMGQYEGTMTLQQPNHEDIFGAYKARRVGQNYDAYSGTIRGHRDSKSFFADLMWASDKIRWVVTSDNIDEDDATLQIRGNMQEWKIGSDGNWVKEGDTQEFLATAVKQ